MELLINGMENFMSLVDFNKNRIHVNNPLFIYKNNIDIHDLWMLKRV